jgi:hypothetical protein
VREVSKSGRANRNSAGLCERRRYACPVYQIHCSLLSIARRSSVDKAYDKASRQYWFTGSSALACTGVVLGLFGIEIALNIRRDGRSFTYGLPTTTQESSPTACNVLHGL